MKKYTNREYNQILEKLPLEIREVVGAYSTAEKMWNIGKGHHLQIDQIGIMIDLALDVMMGIIPSKSFVDEMAEKLKISKLDAQTVVRSIDDEIFKPIRDIMVKTYGEGAPFRPKTMQTISEREEHPDELHKEDILRGIEDPEESVVKTASGNVLNRKELPPPEKEAHPIEEKPKEAELPDPLKQSKERVLNLISSKKLDSIVKMAKEKTAALVLPQAPEEPAIPSPIPQKPAPFPASEPSFSIPAPQIPAPLSIIPSTPPSSPQKTDAPKEKHLAPSPIFGGEKIIDPYRE